MGRDKQFPLSTQLEDNLEVLLFALNKLRIKYGKPMFVSSGYRPPEINGATPGASRNSLHQVCLACDFRDSNKELAKWCLENLNVLAECGLWLENPAHTPNWVHVQAKAPRSSNRVFNP